MNPISGSLPPPSPRENARLPLQEATKPLRYFKMVCIYVLTTNFGMNFMIDTFECPFLIQAYVYLSQETCSHAMCLLNGIT